MSTHPALTGNHTEPFSHMAASAIAQSEADVTTTLIQIATSGTTMATERHRSLCILKKTTQYQYHMFNRGSTLMGTYSELFNFNCQYPDSIHITRQPPLIIKQKRSHMPHHVSKKRSYQPQQLREEESYSMLSTLGLCNQTTHSNNTTRKPSTTINHTYYDMPDSLRTTNIKKRVKDQGPKR